MNHDNLTVAFAMVSVVIILAAIIFAAIYPIDQAMMTVRTCSWKYTIQELEDYQVWVCHTNYNRVCSGSGDERTCTDVPSQSCGWETRTKVHNTWITGGYYPVEPFWEVNYKIRPGNYEHRWQEYTIYFSDDKELYPYGVYSLEQYTTFVPRQRYLTKLNLFGNIIDVEKEKSK